MQQLLRHKAQGEHYYVPNYQAERVREIDFEALAAHGVRCAAIDIDRTLVSHGGMELDAQTLAFIREQKERGHIERLAVATNRIDTEHVRPFADALEADAIMYGSGWRRKPARAYYEQLLKKLDCAAGETVMIGDKLWQDVFGANRMGLVTVLVEPLGPPAWFDWLVLSSWRQERKLREAMKKI